MPLCRRCHRTYHDFGVEWFDDELLDRAIEVENMRRKIFGEPPLERKDIVRSDYWYKKHGIRRPEPSRSFTHPRLMVGPGIEPICGWDWLEENWNKEVPEQGITVFFKGKELVAMPSTAVKPRLIKSVMKMAINVSKYKEVQSGKDS